MTGVFNLTVYEYKQSTVNYCGPFKDREPLSNIFISEMRSNVLFNGLYDLFTSPTILICLLLVIAAILIFFANDTTAYKSYIKEKEKENQSYQELMDDLLSKIKFRNDLLEDKKKVPKNNNTEISLSKVDENEENINEDNNDGNNVGNNDGYNDGNNDGYNSENGIYSKNGSGNENKILIGNN